MSVTVELVAFYERLCPSLFVFHKGRQLRSFRVGQQHLDFFVFQPHLDEKYHPKLQQNILLHSGMIMTNSLVQTQFFVA